MAFAPAKFSELIAKTCFERGVAAGEIKNESHYGWGTPWFKNNHAKIAVELISGLPMSNRISLAKYAAKSDRDHVLMACFQSGVSPRTVDSNGRQLYLSLISGPDFVAVERFIDGGYSDEDINAISLLVGSLYEIKDKDSINGFGRLKNKLLPFSVLTGITRASFPDSKLQLAKWAVEKIRSRQKRGIRLSDGVNVSHIAISAVSAKAMSIADLLIKSFPDQIKQEGGLYRPFFTLLSNSGYKVRSIHSSFEFEKRRKDLIGDFKKLVRSYRKAGLQPTIDSQALVQLAKMGDPKITEFVVNALRNKEAVLEENVNSVFGNGYGYGGRLAGNMQMPKSLIELRGAAIDIKSLYNNSLDLLISYFGNETGLIDKMNNGDRAVFVSDYFALVTDSNQVTGISPLSVHSKLLCFVAKNLSFGDKERDEFAKKTTSLFYRQRATSILCHAGDGGPEDALLFYLARGGMRLLSSASPLKLDLVEALSPEQRICLANHIVAEYKQQIDAGQKPTLVDGFADLVKRLERATGLDACMVSQSNKAARRLIDLSDECAFLYTRSFMSSMLDFDLAARTMRGIGVPDHIAAAAMFYKITSGASIGAYGPGEVADGAREIARLYGGDVVRRAFSSPVFVSLCESDTGTPARPYRLYIAMKATGSWADNGSLVISILKPDEAGSGARVASLIKAMMLPIHNGIDDIKALVRDIKVDCLRVASEDMYKIDRDVVRQQKREQDWRPLVSELVQQVNSGIPSDIAIDGLVGHITNGYCEGSFSDRSIIKDIDFDYLQRRLKDETGVDFGEHFRSRVANNVLRSVISGASRSFDSGSMFRQQHIEFFVCACQSVNYCPSRNAAEVVLDEIKRATGRSLEIEGEIQSVIDHYEMAKMIDDAAKPSMTNAEDRECAPAIRRRASVL